MQESLNNILTKAEINKIQRHFWNGLRFQKKGYRKEAVIEYDEALWVYPLIVEPLYNRALIFYHMRRYTEAISDLNMAVRVDHQHYESYNLLGCCLFMMGKKDDARNYWWDAMNIHSRYELGAKNIKLYWKDKGMVSPEGYDAD